MSYQGGAHLTANSFLPTTLLKDLTGTEYSGSLDISVLKHMTALQQLNDLQVFVLKCLHIFTFNEHRNSTTEWVTPGRCETG